MAITLSERSRMILRLLLFIGSVVVIGFGLYWLFFSNPPSVITPPPTGTTPPVTGTLPNTQDGRTPGSEVPQGSGRLPPSSVANGGSTLVTRLTQTSVTTPKLTSSGEVAYYDAADGRFYTIDSTGNVSALALTQFPSAETVVFNSTATAAIIEFPDGSNIVYDFATAEQVSLPAHWEDFSFSENGDSIVSKSMGTDVSNRALVIASADGSSTKVVAELGNNADDVIVNWSPEGSVLGFSQTGGGTSGAFGQHQIYTLDQNGEAAGILTVAGTNYSSIWSPSGDYILYSVADASDDYRPGLWYVDAGGDRSGGIRLHLAIKTLSEKCTFASETTIYCAVPVETPAGSGASPEVLSAPDVVYKIELPSGTASVVATPVIETEMFSLSVNENESMLYYTDSRGALYAMRLK